MDVVISDLDGTLLDHSTYAFEAALPGLRLLEERGVPLIFCTSKTRSETEYWRGATGNRHPFVVENGGALYIPETYFPFPITGARARGEHVIIELGAPYAELVRSLAHAVAESRCPVRGFHAMTVEEVGAICGMDARFAALAKEREYDEPFLVPDSGTEKLPDLAAAIERAGRRYTRGGRFHHITGDNDKAAAIRILLALYHTREPAVRSVGLGDGMNDAPFLNEVDIPILLPSAAIDDLRKAVPGGRPAASPGPAGWSAAICSLFS